VWRRGVPLRLHDPPWHTRGRAPRSPRRAAAAGRAGTGVRRGRGVRSPEAVHGEACARADLSSPVPARLRGRGALHRAPRARRRALAEGAAPLRVHRGDEAPVPALRGRRRLRWVPRPLPLPGEWREGLRTRLLVGRPVPEGLPLRGPGRRRWAGGASPVHPRGRVLRVRPGLLRAGGAPPRAPRRWARAAERRRRAAGPGSRAGLGVADDPTWSAAERCEPARLAEPDRRGAEPGAGPQPGDAARVDQDHRRRAADACAQRRGHAAAGSDVATHRRGTPAGALAERLRIEHVESPRPTARGEERREVVRTRR
jgi:hypothetical protein